MTFLCSGMTMQLQGNKMLDNVYGRRIGSISKPWEHFSGLQMSYGPVWETKKTCRLSRGPSAFSHKSVTSQHSVSEKAPEKSGSGTETVLPLNPCHPLSEQSEDDIDVLAFGKQQPESIANPLYETSTPAPPESSCDPFTVSLPFTLGQGLSGIQNAAFQLSCTPGRAPF